MRAIIIVICLPILCFACSGPLKITEKGLAYAKLGNPMPPDGTISLEGVSVRDTLFDEGGFQWRALILSYPNGEVFIEEDFANQGLINRIRVVTPDLKVSKKQAIGMSWMDLYPLKNNWDAIYLEKYGVWDVISKSQSRIHYLLEEKRDTSSVDISAGWKSIADDARLSAIVVM